VEVEWSWDGRVFFRDFFEMLLEICEREREKVVNKCVLRPAVGEEKKKKKGV